jgi:hypothetical protein
MQKQRRASGELVTGGRRLCPFSRFFRKPFRKTTQQDSAPRLDALRPSCRPFPTGHPAH